MTNQLQTAEKQEKVIIKLTPQIAKRVDKKVREELVKQYRKLFTGFSLEKWTQKYSWGRAWQNGLNLNGAMIMIAKKQMTPNNPAVKYLENVHAAYKKHWSKTIMTHPERDTKTVLSDKSVKKMHVHAIRMINDATNAIMTILRKYNERTYEMIIEQTQSQGAEHAQPTKTATPAQQPAPVQTNAKPEQIEKPAVAKPAMVQPAIAVKQPEQIATPAGAKHALAQPMVAQEKAVAQPDAVKPITMQKPVTTVHMSKSVPAKQTIECPALAKQQAIAKQPYTAPQISVNNIKSHSRNTAPITQQRPYTAPTITTRTNAFNSAANRAEIKRATAQMRFQQQIKIFTMGQYKQNVA